MDNKSSKRITILLTVIIVILLVFGMTMVYMLKTAIKSAGTQNIEAEKTETSDNNDLDSQHELEALNSENSSNNTEDLSKDAEVDKDAQDAIDEGSKPHFETENPPVDSEDTDADLIQQLSVKDGRIVDENGNVFQLKGMSSHGLLWYPEYTNYPAVKTTKDRGANAFRIAMYVNEQYGGYIQNKDMSEKLLHSAVQNIKEANMYAVIDWHILNEHNPLYDVEVAKTFFEETSRRYGNDPQIIYEICNEPNNEATWADISNYANQVIPIIRHNAPDSLIIVGTPDYSYSVKAVIGNTLPYENVLYSFHFYAGQFPNEYRDIISECENQGVPVIISEWGINTDSDSKARVYGQEFIDYINSEKISWFAWSLCNKDECFSAIRSDCKELFNWSDEQLTEVGRIFFNAFR